MKFEDVLDVTKKALAQSMGGEYMEQLGDLAALDDAKLVDVGRGVLEGNGTTEKFTKALVSVIGKIEFDSREYKISTPSIVVNSMDWGGFVEDVQFDVSENIMQDPMYNLVDGQSYAEAEHRFYQPKVAVKIFEEAKTFLIPVSVTREILREAFYSWDKLNSYISGIRNAINTTKTAILEAYSHMLLSAAAANSIAGTQTAINLLAMAKSEGRVDAAMTPAAAIKDKDFLTFCTSKISLYRKYMERLLKGAFNNGNIPTFTPEDDNNLVLLAEFAENIKTIVKANTFNEKYIGVGEYESVSAWQAFKDTDVANFNFVTDSTISIAADSTEKLGIGDEAFTQSYVIGICFDKKALGICPYRVKTTQSYTAIGDFSNTFTHLLFNYKLNNSYNIVAFYLA
jgi:hypothetical protein